MRPTVTFDFHNTLINCDSWFNLEVAELPGKVARALEHAGDHSTIRLDDAVLTDTYRQLRAEIIAHGNELDAADGVVETFSRLGQNLERSALAEVVDGLFRQLVESSAVCDGVRETLEYLELSLVQMGVVSSAVHHDFLEWTLAYHGLRGYFADVVTSASSGFYKSRPDIFRTACERLDVSPDAAVHVGDSFRFDHLGAKSAGLRTVWINHHAVPAQIGTPRPTLELGSLIGAGPHIQQMLAETGRAG